MRHTIGQIHFLQGFQRAHTTRRTRHASIDKWELYIVQRGRPRQEIERLKDESDLFIANPRQLIVIEFSHLVIVEPITSLAWRVETSDKVHQC